VRDALRGRFIDGLKAAGSGPKLVVAHSMGTVIAYDCLMNVPDCPPIDGLVTVGSPLGLSEVQAFFPGYQAANAFPAHRLRGRWLNVYDPLDPIAGLDPVFADDYQRAGHEVIDDLREDNWGTWRHSIVKYLQGPKLRARLAQMLALDWP
jgi:pimeloyl-ACP methyl ester carboxylesterase